jgi:hypothetical protein
MDHPTPPQRIPVAGRTTGSSAGFKLD